MREARVYYLNDDMRMFSIDTFEAAVLFYMNAVVNPDVRLVEISYITESADRLNEFRYETPLSLTNS